MKSSKKARSPLFSVRDWIYFWLVFIGAVAAITLFVLGFVRMNLPPHIQVLIVFAILINIREIKDLVSEEKDNYDS